MIQSIDSKKKKNKIILSRPCLQRLAITNQAQKYNLGLPELENVKSILIIIQYA